jgi:hypothetical protein
VPLPIERDRLMLGMMAFNLAFTGFDVFLAHSLGTVQNLFMMIPIFYTPIGVLPIALLALTNSRKPLLMWTHFAAMGLGLTVGLVGFAFHLRTVKLPGAEFLWGGLIFSAPVLASLAFSGICGMGITAAVEEIRPGHYVLPGLAVISLGVTKRQLYFLFIGLGIGAATVSAAIEHSQEGYLNWTMWLPVILGGLCAGAMIGHAWHREPPISELIFVLGACGVAVPLGILGFAFHASFDASAAGGISVERMVHGAPLFAPMLFADLGTLGILAAGKRVTRVVSEAQLVSRES